MKKLALTLLLLQTSFIFADKPKPNPADYPLTVHVACSFMRGQSGTREYTLLDVTIDGKQLELSTFYTNAAVFALGDYKARLLKDQSPNTYDIDRTYELLLPDGKLRSFQVSGFGAACPAATP